MRKFIGYLLFIVFVPIAYIGLKLAGKPKQTDEDYIDWTINSR